MDFNIIEIARSFITKYYDGEVQILDFSMGVPVEVKFRGGYEKVDGGHESHLNSILSQTGNYFRFANPLPENMKNRKDVGY